MTVRFRPVALMGYLDEGEETVREDTNPAVTGLYDAKPVSDDEKDLQAVQTPEFTVEDEEDADEGPQYEVVETRPAEHPWKPKPTEVVFTGTKEEAETKLANLERRHASDRNKYSLRKA